MAMMFFSENDEVFTMAQLKAFYDEDHEEDETFDDFIRNSTSRNGSLTKIDSCDEPRIMEIVLEMAYVSECEFSYEWLKGKRLYPYYFAYIARSMECVEDVEICGGDVTVIYK